MRTGTAAVQSIACKLLFWVLLLFPVLGHALDVPPLRGHINDYASLLSPQTVNNLERLLTDFEDSDSTQIAVLTIPSLAGEDLEQFSIKVAEAWKIGWKGKDNGAILLIAKQEHKIRIEVGRGLEGKLTDLVSGRIIRDEMSPRFKSGDFDGGITAGVTAIMAVVKGEYKGTGRDLRHGKTGRGHASNPLFTLLIFAGVAAVFFGAISRILGGVAGAIGLPVAAFLALPGLSLVMLLLLAVAGFIAGIVISLLFSGGGFFGGPFGGFGGGFGGGGDFGGGDSGFSGGGGDFGGGGASGDW